MAPVKPLLRGHFHQAMFFIALGACLTLFFQCDSSAERTVVAVYSLCGLAMFGISSIYHRVTWEPKKRAFWRKLDHAGIFLMIAGSFTPVAYLGLEPEQAKTLLITIWCVAAVGILQSIFFVNIPKIASALIYIVAGYLILPYFSELKASIGDANSWLLLGGGIVYSLGALSYGLKWPKLNPAVFSYHEVFHLMVNIAAILHFIVIASLVL